MTTNDTSINKTMIAASEDEIEDDLFGGVDSEQKIKEFKMERAMSFAPDLSLVHQQ